MSSMQKTDRTNYSLFLACVDIGLVWSSLVWKKSFAYGFDQKGAINNNFLVFEAILPGVTNNQTPNRVILKRACPYLLL